MRNAEVRGICRALIHNRVCAAEPAADPSPIAMGWQLESGRASARAMAALCAGTVGGRRATRWRASASLRALLREYHSLREDVAPAAKRDAPIGRSAPAPL